MHKVKTCFIWYTKSIKCIQKEKKYDSNAYYLGYEGSIKHSKEKVQGLKAQYPGDESSKAHYLGDEGSKVHLKRKIG